MKLTKYKSQKNNDLTSMLKSYSALTGAFLLSAGAVQGQVVFTDINPDTLLQNNTFDIDFDNDGIREFAIQQYTSTYYQAERRVNLLAGVDPANRPMASLANFMFWSAYTPQNLPAGNPIGPGGPFLNFGVIGGQGIYGMLMVKKWMQQGMGSNFYWTGRGPFLDSTGYIGVEFNSNGNIYYGWIQCAIDNEVQGITITGYAYDATPGHYIIAGNGNTSSLQEQQSAISPAASFYPNPVRNGKTFIQIEAKHSADLRLEIINGMGQLLQSDTRNLNPGKNVVELDVNNLAAGTYFVKIMEGENSYFRKILINK